MIIDDLGIRPLRHDDPIEVCAPSGAVQTSSGAERVRARRARVRRRLRGRAGAGAAPRRAPRAASSSSSTSRRRSATLVMSGSRWAGSGFNMPRGHDRCSDRALGGAGCSGHVPAACRAGGRTPLERASGRPQSPRVRACGMVNLRRPGFDGAVGGP